MFSSVFVIHKNCFVIKYPPFVVTDYYYVIIPHKYKKRNPFVSELRFMFGCGDGIPTTWSCQILCGEFVFGHLAVLTVHRTVIHCRSVVRKTLCVFLTASELFALRAHNPAPMWVQPTPQAKRKATQMGCFSFWLRRWDLNHMTSGL